MRYIKVFLTHLVSDDMTMIDAVVGGFVLSHIDLSGGFWRAKVSTISKGLGLGSRTVSRSLSVLVNCGVIERQLTGRSSIFRRPAPTAGSGPIQYPPHRILAVGVPPDVQGYAWAWEFVEQFFVWRPAPRRQMMGLSEWVAAGYSSEQIQAALSGKGQLPQYYKIGLSLLTVSREAEQLWRAILDAPWLWRQRFFNVDWARLHAAKITDGTYKRNKWRDK